MIPIKNGVIRKNGVILNGKKERVPDGDTLCCYRCGAIEVAAIRSQRQPAW